MLRSELELAKMMLALQPSPTKESTPINKVAWKANQIDLIELVYALYYSNIFGDMKLKEIFSTVAMTFDVNIQNYSHAFSRLRGKSLDRCAFLKKLLYNLERVLEEKDK